MKKQILIATTNKGKLEDIREILKSANAEIISFLDFSDYPIIVEDGDSFQANAQKKAEIAFDKYKIPSIGDDSGLSVDQLDGMPGIYSARFAGENATDFDNNKKLLKDLEKFPEPHKAKYVCAAVYYDGKKFVTTYGEVKGKIIKSPRGQNGFGYDPYFVAEGLKNTMAEISLEEKNKISHRLKAFIQLKELVLS